MSHFSGWPGKWEQKCLQGSGSVIEGEEAIILSKRFKEMPRTILVLFFLFLLIPIASSVFRDSLSRGFSGRAGWALFLVSYCLMPLLLCYAIAVKHYLFLPFYLVQCAALIAHSIGSAQILPSDIVATRLILIGMMVYVGIIFGNKDFFYPFLTKKHRSLRRFAPSPGRFRLLCTLSGSRLRLNLRLAFNDLQWRI